MSSPVRRGAAPRTFMLMAVFAHPRFLQRLICADATLPIALA